MGLDRNSVLEQMDLVEEVFKAQIVGGKNSNPLNNGTTSSDHTKTNWAGTEEEDLDFPNTTPNGTDWDPKPGDRAPHKASNRGSGPRTRKALNEFSDAELRREMNVRKSNTPNPSMADFEIMNNVPGVEKAVCGDCDGNALHKGWYCDSCNNLGTVYNVTTQEAGEMVKSIQEKWNLHLIDRDYWKSQNVNTGGGVDEADTTPKNTTDMREEVEDHTGEMVAKGEAMASECEEMAEEIGKGKGKGNGDMDFGDMDMEDVAEDVDRCKKGIELVLKGLAFIGRRQNALLKAGYIQASVHKSIGVQVADMGQDVEWLVRAVQKGKNMDEVLEEVGEEEEMGKGVNSRRNGPARGPVSVGPGVNVHVIQKSHVDQAPGRGLQGEGADGGNPNGLDHNYDLEVMKSAATYMGVHRLMNRQDALSLDTGMWPTEKVEKSIVAFLDKNNGVVPALGDGLE